MTRDEFYSVLGKRIREARLSAGMTQADLARCLRMTRVSVTNMEAGRQAPSAWRLAQIAAVCKLLPHQLLDPDYTLKPKKPYQVTEWR